MKFPFGECECRDGCQCALRPGPAAFAAVRNGRKVKLCTRCDVSSDKPTLELLVQRDTPIGPFLEWDGLGALAIGLEIKLGGSQ